MRWTGRRESQNVEDVRGRGFAVGRGVSTGCGGILLVVVVAAASIGDDRMQGLSQGYVQPETWTHGFSEQRVAWLRRGLEAGDVSKCDTFRSGSP